MQEKGELVCDCDETYAFPVESGQQFVLCRGCGKKWPLENGNVPLEAKIDAALATGAPLQEGPFAVLTRHWAANPRRTLPDDSVERKGIPIMGGVIRYAPAALACMAIVSKIGNDKHNPGQPLHHARSKSTDHDECIMRHVVDANDEPTELEHRACRLWRDAIELQELCEKLGAPMAPGARK